MTQPPIRYRKDGGLVTLPANVKTDLEPWTPPEPSVIRKFIGNLLTARYGGNPVLSEQQPPKAVSSTGAMLKLNAVKAELHALRMTVGEISSRAVPYHGAEKSYRDAVAVLQSAEQDDVNADAHHKANGTTDTGMAERARLIADAEQRSVAAARARQVAAAVIRQCDADMKPVLEQIKAIESQWPHLQRAALLEELESLAPEFKQAAQRMYDVSTRAFGICAVLGSLLRHTGGTSCGDGLGSHLVIPTPTLHPAFDFVTVPNIRGAVAAETARIMEDLKR
jgi:hypothetical protein